MQPKGSEYYNRNHSIQKLGVGKIRTHAVNPEKDFDIHGFKDMGFKL